MFLILDFVIYIDLLIQLMNSLADRWRRAAAADNEFRCSSSDCRLPIDTIAST